MTDIRQMNEWGEWLSKIGWKTKQIESTNIFIYKFPLLGVSMMKAQRYSGTINAEELKALKKKERVVYSVFEPLEKEQIDEIPFGAKLMREPYLPTKTRVVDLNNKEDVWKGLSENARRWIKKNEKTPIREVSWVDFYSMWVKWCPSIVYNKKSFGLLAEVMGEKMRYWSSGANGEHSGVAEITTKEGRHYFQTWTSEKGKESGAHYKLVFESMMQGINEGSKYYDFEGIFDERFPLKKWGGFTEFKRRFGGREVEYPGAFAKWF